MSAPTIFVVLLGSPSSVDSIWTVESDAQARADFLQAACVEEFDVDDFDLKRKLVCKHGEV